MKLVLSLVLLAACTSQAFAKRAPPGFLTGHPGMVQSPPPSPEPPSPTPPSPSPPAVLQLPDVLQYSRLGQYPEGLEWDATRNAFLVGSVVRAGVITIVYLNGTTEDLVTDPGIQNISTIGLKISHGRVHCGLYSGISSPGLNFEGVGVWDLKTGERIHLLNLTGLGPMLPPLKANDVTTDPEGNMYVTEDYQPAIWKVTADGVPSLFSSHVDFYRAAETVVPLPDYLNGIVYHPLGFLLSVSTKQGLLYKINITTGVPTLVKGVFVPSGNGLRIRNDGKLVVSTSGAIYVGRQERAYLLESWGNGNWDWGAVVDVVLLDNARFPCQNALVPDPEDPTKPEISYVNYSHLLERQQGILNVTDFEIERIRFSA